MKVWNRLRGGWSREIPSSEINKTPIENAAHIDSLFQRMFALVYLLLGNPVKPKPDEPSQADINEDDLPF